MERYKEKKKIINESEYSETRTISSRRIEASIELVSKKIPDNQKKILRMKKNERTISKKMISEKRKSRMEHVQLINLLIVFSCYIY